MDFLGCIEQTYDGFTPHHQFFGKLGELHIYIMNNVGGVSMYLARDALSQNNFSLLKCTVRDFAMYVDLNVLYAPKIRVADLTLSIQVFRLGMAQNAEGDATSESYFAVQRVLNGTLPAPEWAARAFSANGSLSHLDAPEGLGRRLAARAQPHRPPRQ